MNDVVPVADAKRGILLTDKVDMQWLSFVESE